ncbi:Site-specific recombinase XerD [Nocardia otitidiscaviarum]|uniref:Site-specific recombinase XerD n=1 Tax=Nocardia otitidiscaviarum TaxID=1823 RepID=A0A379JI43_9NOCA|nr:Site-specific recombinase XerD [Nocardia otitidiscaviarum]
MSPVDCPDWLFASRRGIAAIGAGANIEVVQRMLGHKTPKLTLDPYGHLFSDDLDAVADAMDAAARTAADRMRTGPFR